MLDDGEVERRVRLIRPMERPAFPWRRWLRPTGRKRPRDFCQGLGAEVAAVPEFVDSTIHIVAGLLLPIWKRLPNESTRVYRLQTDAGSALSQNGLGDMGRRRAGNGRRHSLFGRRLHRADGWQNRP